MMLDSHVHFDSFPSRIEREDAIRRARGAGVGMMVAIGGNDEGNRVAVETAKAYPQICAAVGYERDEAEQVPDLEPVAGFLDEGCAVAVGEIGLDYHYSADTAQAQVELFRRQLALAAERQVPVVIHSREADDDTLRCLEEHVGSWRGDTARIGVLHCFTGSGPFAKRLLDLGLMISFSGMITFRNAASLREVAASVPGDRILVETDTPYLAPVPKRGKKNEPAYLVHVVEALAKIRGDTVEGIAHSTTENARKLFLG